MSYTMKQDEVYCRACGQLNDEEVTRKLDELYYRWDGKGRQTIEPHVYVGEELEEMGYYDDEDTRDAVMLAMEKNMAQRGLCTGCGRFDLRRAKPEDILSLKEAQDMHDMYAEMEAERRAGC